MFTSLLILCIVAWSICGMAYTIQCAVLVDDKLTNLKVALGGPLIWATIVFGAIYLYTNSDPYNYNYSNINWWEWMVFFKFIVTLIVLLIGHFTHSVILICIGFGLIPIAIISMILEQRRYEASK